jgi:hypothetical protein
MATRREFIQKSALGAAGLSLGAKSYSRIIGANDRVRVEVSVRSLTLRLLLFRTFGTGGVMKLRPFLKGKGS